MFLNKTGGNNFSDTPASGIYICPAAADSIADETLGVVGAANLFKMAARPIRIDDAAGAFGTNVNSDLMEIYYTNCEEATLFAGSFLRCIATTASGPGGINAVGSLRVLLIEEEDC